MNDNKRLAKNTLFLYLRMLVVMAVSFYTTREILRLLGVVDYGIYNVVGGIVAMFSFVNSTLMTSSQRYFSIELAKGNLKRLNQWFCLNITAFSIFIGVFILISETIGLWFINTQLTIPVERLFAANVVYQLSILTFCIHFFCIPYSALIVAHEKMSAFAYISIIEAFLKLVIAFILSIITWDKLIIYAILMCLSSLTITLSYVIYNRKHFSESKYSLYWNKKECLELVSFSGWHLLGTFSTVIRSQGINILINLFFNPAINAARAISFQLYHAVSQLSSNFFVAVKPQIYKTYADGDYLGLHNLILRSTIMSSYLVAILIFPVLSNTSYLIGLWLKEIPDYTVIFTQLVLINGLIDSTNGPAIASALATGKIKKFIIVVSIINLSNLPLSYFFLFYGAEPTITMLISIVLSLVSVFVRGYLLKGMIDFPFNRYLNLVYRLIIANLLIGCTLNCTIYNKIDNFRLMIVISLFIVLFISLIYMLLVFDKHDRKNILLFLQRKCRI